MVGAVVLAVGAVLVVRSAGDLRTTVADVGVAAILMSGALAVLGTVLISRVWFTLLRGLAVDVPAVEATRVFFVSQLGKYIPGSVWPIMAQMEFGRRWGTSRRTMLAANILMLTLLTATGLMVGAVLLPWSSSAGLSRYWWTLLLLPLLLVCLHPRAIPGALDLALGLVGREPLGLRTTGRSMVLATSWSFGVWAVMGLHLLVMTRAAGATGLTGVAAAVGGMGAAWAAGLIFIPAPAGVGVRDAILVATFAPQIGAAPALAVSLASRLLLLLADVVLAGVGAALRPGRSREPG